MGRNTKQVNAARQQKNSLVNKQEPQSPSSSIQERWHNYLNWAGIIFLLFLLYAFGIWHNPPGFYVDESGLAYNAYLVSKTGAGEFGSRFPLFFQFYTGGFTQYANPTSVYLLALTFWIFGPGILTARLLAAVSMYAASLSLGALAARTSGKRSIGFIVALIALVTPWLFEVGRLMLETFFYPMAVVLFLWTVYRAQSKSKWMWSDCLLVAVTLAFLTYSYTIGRLLAPLLALGLLCFATNKQKLFSIVKTWFIYGITLIPLLIFKLQHPDLTTRFYLLTYIKPESTTWEIITKFISRFLEDINPITLILKGDINQRHHMPDAFGSFYLAAFILAVIGVIVIFVRHRRESWWWFILFGLFSSVVPAALTVDKVHTLRMIAYPVFLLMLTVPALKWMLDPPEKERQEKDETGPIVPMNKKISPFGQGFWHWQRILLVLLLITTTVEASYFHWKYQREGGKRGYIFDEAYKQVYDTAVAQPSRPIYLVDNYWGPAYIHSFWYATLEKRSITEFVHQPYGVTPPANVIVISTERDCTNCDIISRNRDYLLYRTK